MKNKTLLTKIQGGLGNQMFQYATGYAYSRRFKKELKLDLSFYEGEQSEKDTPRFFQLNEFDIHYNKASDEEIKRNKPTNIFYKIYKKLNKDFIDFCPSLLKNKRYKYLEGYFQSEKNFKDFEKEIKKIFKSKTVPAQKPERNSLSIHVRRGDYLTNKYASKHHGVLDLEYYNKAYKLIKNKFNISNVYIFTDDPKWIIKNFGFINEKTIMVSDLNLSNSEEILLMSQCSHNIIANSSFSWWGAWLNENPEKIVISPKKWLRLGDGPHKNIIPESWMRI